jgi:hypothetical protein
MGLTRPATPGDGDHSGAEATQILAEITSLACCEFFGCKPAHVPDSDLQPRPDAYPVRGPVSRPPPPRRPAVPRGRHQLAGQQQRPVAGVGLVLAVAGEHVLADGERARPDRPGEVSRLGVTMRADSGECQASSGGAVVKHLPSATRGR